MHTYVYMCSHQCCRYLHKREHTLSYSLSLSLSASKPMQEEVHKHEVYTNVTKVNK